MSHIDFPFRIDPSGRTAVTTDADYARDLIEQVLFTSPGERVNRPDFGCGLMQLVFAGNSNELATATQFLVQGSLQRWLAGVIQVESVTVASQDSKLEVTVQYRLAGDAAQQSATFEREF